MSLVLAAAIILAMQASGPPPRPEAALAGSRRSWRAASQAKADIETLASDTMSGIDSPRQAVARNEKEWAALWQQHSGPSRPAPKVDFSKRIVVAVFLGSRPSAGYRAEVSGTRQDGKTLIVTWRELPPDRDSLSAMVITSPAHLASIPRFEGEIKFEKAGK